ncbi:hypothetical protein [Acidithiobacillus thiooxidans]|uniref:Uncharacterized protein n=1 Tax=Acidithiobacillus thiooxidans ATCC 19377 TaxID=637390 RepID=A0A543PYL9_ACITH|nr:hypothetical protein [Acidithiobacillus thiooxidans]MDX5936766.1 hypothetical protein [Acidithiobacillus thiooxidans]MDX5936778.1 hypothetical protein [Acidithiobacillus thiooxidans]TQN49177.1 hypothetical protein DLNHIDIE_03495 [Acidithiobacillus thiooxidans ATCC 19377]
MGLKPQEQSWLHEYRGKSDEELALLSVYNGPGLDSPNRAALARHILDCRHAKIRDEREEKIFQQAERALKISNETARATSKQALLAMLAIIISLASAAALYLK